MIDNISLNIENLATQLLVYNSESPLIFSSGLFLFLFLAFTFFYTRLRSNLKLRILYVIAFSLYFYYKSSGIYFLLLIFVALSDFFIGKALISSAFQLCRRWLVALSLSINLGLLFYFKYTNFFIDIINSLSASNVFEFQNLFLPVGISFFVFQSLSYTIDIYRGNLKPLDQFQDYLFYLSFFPQLVAGPIVRARDFIPQIRQNPLFISGDMFRKAMFLISSGLFKKAIVSDYISLNFVDRIFDMPHLYSGFENLMGVYGYALQIYCDFSGYSDMAIGIALLLGFKFNDNFNSPYKSASITEFWRRWHISLSLWLKDYLYISLGGNRRSKLRTYFNLMITMLLGGLWHGAALRFVVWGGLHGVALAIHKMTMNRFPNLKMPVSELPRWRRVLGIFLTFNFVCLTWIFFRANDIDTVKTILSQIFTNFDLSLIPQVVEGYWKAMLLIGIGYLLHFTPESLEHKVYNKFMGMNIWTIALIVTFLIWLIMQVKSSEVQPFIYFQF